MSEDGRKCGQCGIAEKRTTGISDGKDEDNNDDKDGAEIVELWKGADLEDNS